MASEDVIVTRSHTAERKLQDLDMAARAGLLQAGAYLVNRTQRTFQLFAPRGHASGQLIRSLGVGPVMFLPGRNLYLCRVGPRVGYAWWVHQGTGPAAGHGPRGWPPPDAILAWVKEKGLVPKMQRISLGGSRRASVKRKRIDIERDQRALAFLIGRKIATMGTKPFPFLVATYKAVKPDLERIITGSLVQALCKT